MGGRLDARSARRRAEAQLRELATLLVMGDAAARGESLSRFEGPNAAADLERDDALPEMEVRLLRSFFLDQLAAKERRTLLKARYVGSAARIEQGDDGGDVRGQVDALEVGVVGARREVHHRVSIDREVHQLRERVGVERAEIELFMCHRSGESGGPRAAVDADHVVLLLHQPVRDRPPDPSAASRHDYPPAFHRIDKTRTRRFG